MDDANRPPERNRDRLALTPEGDLLQRPLRLAVIGTPRSGNTWIRGLLAALYGLEEIAVDRPDQVDWERLSPRCIIQIHQAPEPAFTALIARQNVRVVTPSRHPLDVMISALNYAQYTPTAPQWTDRTGTVRTLRGATPIGPEFLEYAGITHPGSVLTFSPAWWERPGVFQVRYEDLVSDPGQVLIDLATRIDVRIMRPVEEVVPSFSIEARRSNVQVWQYHFGLGQPGIWRELIPAPQALEIARRQAAVFETIGYTCDPDPSLDELTAERNWYRLQTHLLGRHLADERRRLEESRAQLRQALTERVASSPARDRVFRLDSHRARSFWSWGRRFPSGLRRLWSRAESTR